MAFYGNDLGVKRVFMERDLAIYGNLWRFMVNPFPTMVISVTIYVAVLGTGSAMDPSWLAIRLGSSSHGKSGK